MIIGFIGDVHGQVFHATALAATWQVVTGKRFDILIQVGDMGAYPNTPNDAATERYLALDPSQADFSRLLKADGKLAAHLRQVRECLAGPIYFVRGNHEDFDFLNHLQVDGTAKSAAVDPFDLYRYVPDGTVLEFDGTKVAFLGGVEERSDARAIDKEAYQSLMDLGPGRIDILVTHEGPYGTSTGYHGDVHGSHMMTRLIESIKPTYHVAGHAHQVSGPTTFGPTTYLGLDGLVASARWEPERNGFKEGCLAVLDTANDTLQPVTDSWLSIFDTKTFDFSSWFEGFTS